MMIVVTTIFYSNLYDQAAGALVGKIAMVDAIVITMQTNPVFRSTSRFLTFARIITIIDGTAGNAAMGSWMFFVQLEFYHFEIRSPCFMKVESF